MVSSADSLKNFSCVVPSLNTFKYLFCIYMTIKHSKSGNGHLGKSVSERGLRLHVFLQVALECVLRPGPDAVDHWGNLLHRVYNYRTITFHLQVALNGGNL